MKKITINIIYWITTGLLLAMMLFSAASSLMEKPMAQKCWQLLGVIAILTPGFPHLKKWAYAGFTFDLIGATYSFYASGFTIKDWAFIPALIAILACSYIFYDKSLKLKDTVTEGRYVVKNIIIMALQA